jgi:hypothetical protein
MQDEAISRLSAGEAEQFMHMHSPIGSMGWRVFRFGVLMASVFVGSYLVVALSYFMSGGQ